MRILVSGCGDSVTPSSCVRCPQTQLTFRLYEQEALGRVIPKLRLFAFDPKIGEFLNNWLADTQHDAWHVMKRTSVSLYVLKVLYRTQPATVDFVSDLFHFLQYRFHSIGSIDGKPDNAAFCAGSSPLSDHVNPILKIVVIGCFKSMSIAPEPLTKFGLLKHDRFQDIRDFL